MYIVLLIGFMILVMKSLPQLRTVVQRLLSQSKRHFSPGIFENYYLEGKAFYLDRFKIIPCVTCVEGIDVTKAFGYIRERYKYDIVDTYQSCYYNREQGRQEFS